MSCSPWFEFITLDEVMLVAIKQLKILKHEANVKTEDIYLSTLDF